MSLYKIVFLALLTLSFLYKLFLHVRTYRSRHNPIPENVADVYEPEAYLRWKSYSAESTRLAAWSDAAKFAVLFLLLALNVFALTDGIANDFWAAICVTLIALAASALVDAPFQYYGNMNIEERYGFNRYTKKLFWVDQIKGFLLNALFSAALVSLFVLCFRLLGNRMPLAFAAAGLLFIIFTMFLSPLLMRFQFKVRPLEEGELRDKLTAMLEQHGFRVRAIELIDASKRTSKVNASFSGLGKAKTITLFDTMFESFSTDEIVAIFAHEMGHGLHRDILKMVVQQAFLFVLIGLCLWFTASTEAISAAFGFTGVSLGLSYLLVLEAELGVLSPVLDFAQSALSRRDEYAADRQAVEEGYGEAMVSALKKLARVDFSNLSPDPLVVTLSYSHPPIDQRVAAIEAALAARKG